MLEIFQKELAVTICMGVFFALSVLCRMLLGQFYRHMIRETDNMATTENKLLKQCKLKFTNCYQMNKGMPNIPVFVDKFMSRLSAGPLSFEFLYHLSGQLMLLSVVTSGIGVARSILAGRMMGEILPFYIASLLELYLYFSLSALIDIKGYRRILKINLVDYLENHLSARMGVTNQDLEKLYGKQLQLMPLGGREGRGAGLQADGKKGESWAVREGRMTEVQAERRRVVDEAAAESQEGFTRAQEKELESLLTEFLIS